MIRRLLLVLVLVSCSRAPLPDRLVVRTAELDVEVERLEEVAPVLARIEALGGHVVKSDRTSTREELKLRVPSARLDEAMAVLRSPAKHVAASVVHGEDVTEELVDVEARVRTFEATRARLLVLLENAQKVEDTLAINKALTETQGELERVQGRAKFLEQSAAMAAVNVTYRVEGGWEPAAVASSALGALKSLGIGLANALIVIAVFSPVWGLAFLVIRRLRGVRKPGHL